MFVSFAASIHGHIGATEWLEHHLPKLKNRVVAYINLGAKYLVFFSSRSVKMRELSFAQFVYLFENSVIE